MAARFVRTLLFITTGFVACGGPASPVSPDGGASTSDGGYVPLPSSCAATACAFPGAEGFGTSTPGGRGGRVLIVTNLNASGPGSFKEAILTPGPRIIVFRVSGVIDLGGVDNGGLIELTANHSYLTIAGQSSPGGITLTNATISNYQTDLHDLIIRFLRIRGRDSYDNLSFNGAHDFVIDHADFSGGYDETLDITHGYNFTVQWSTVANSVVSERSQNYGALIAYAEMTNVSWHHNLSAHHAGRCGAEFHWGETGSVSPGGASMDVRNNVIYNCAFDDVFTMAIGAGGTGTGVNWNFVGNYAKTGPNTQPGSNFFELQGDLRARDNIYEGQAPEPDSGGSEFSYPAVTTTSAATAYNEVLAWAGVWPRDAMSERTVAEVGNGTGTLGKNDDPMTAAGPAAPPDLDNDGVADEWERAHGMDPSDGDDSTILDPNGYSKIEIYLNELAQERIGN